MQLKSITLKSSVIHRTSLAKQITEILRQEIRANMQLGQSLPPIMEMAKSFGVSYQTVREALSVLEAEGVVDRRSGSGTYVCTPGQGRPVQHVAVWCERDIFDPHASYFYRYVPRQLVRYFQQQGFAAKLYIGEVSHSEPPRAELTCTEFAQAVEQHQICGVVAMDEPTGSQWLASLYEQNIPLVRSREKNGQSKSPCVLSNKTLKGRMGAEYLLSHGRRKIALMQWLEPKPPEARTFNPTMDGFTAALAEAGVEINPKWIRSDLPPGAPGAGWEEFREIWSTSEEKPDGLLVCDDMLFLGAAMAILQLGIRVPEDLLVVTHYNKGSGLKVPFPVVKLQMDPHEYVEELGQALVKLMRGQPVENRAATIELVEAQSIGGAGIRIPDLGVGRGGTPRGENEAAGTARRAVARRPRKAQQV
jgi:DNA-binding LacI/PurR family transcriptional regulator